MRRRRLRIGVPGCWLMLAFTSAAAAAELRADNPPPVPGAAQALTAVIDTRIAAQWQAAGARPAPVASDAEFLRRACLDLTGTIPTVYQAHEFLDDTRDGKRSRLVERLLKSQTYARHMSRTWKDLLVPEAAGDASVRRFAVELDPWLRRMFAENAGYDVFVRAILTADLEPSEGPGRLYAGEGVTTPLGFYAAKQGKPEELAASTARLFLGLRIECAQCHDHPFAAWKRDQFWSYAAFFAGVERVDQSDTSPSSFREVLDRRSLLIPGTDRVVQAGFLDGNALRWRPRTGARAALADWMTAPANPYFARAAVNRVWAQFFGTGLVDPVDDLGAENPPSHPELLDELARQFAAHSFDLKYLIRAITASCAYNLTSAGAAPAREDPRLLARMPLRAMTPWMHFQSLEQAANFRRWPALSPDLEGNDSPRQRFLQKFATQDGQPAEQQTTLSQVLTLMNGRLTGWATTLDEDVGTVAAVAGSPFLDAPGKIEALYLATLSRRPRPEELARLVPYLKSGGPAQDGKQALLDIFWALLNSAEFGLIP